MLYLCATVLQWRHLSNGLELFTLSTYSLVVCSERKREHE